jgi:uncharacterized membrane protein YgcG
VIRSLIPALLVGVAIVGVAGVAQAKSIKHDVPAATLAAFCTEHGVGSETNATLTFDDGRTLTGSIHCEAEDLVASNDDDPATHDVGDDKGGGREAEPGDDHGGHGNEAGDDNSGHGNGSDDGGADDNSGSGSDNSGSGGGGEDHSGYGGGDD